MTDKEYLAECKRIEEECRHKLAELARDYCFEHKKYAVGDILEDSNGRARVVKCKYSMWGSNFPTPIYICENLTKKGTVSKRDPKRSIFEGDHVKNVGHDTTA